MTVDPLVSDAIAPPGDPDAAPGGGLEAAEFGALLSSRICHDLISPVGAIGNGVELLRELDRTADGAELQLIGSSARMASASLQFLRIAFGAATPGDAMGLAQVQRAARMWFDHQRPDLLWPDAAGETTRAAARLLFNFMQVAVSSLPRGGVVRVEAGDLGPAGRRRIAVIGEAPLIRPAADAGLWLSGGASQEPPSPRDVHYLAAAAHARAAGAPVRFLAEAERITLEIELPEGV